MSNKELYQGITVVTDPRVNYKVVYWPSNRKESFDRDTERGENSDGELIYHSEWLDNPVDLETMTKQVDAITKELRKMGVHAWLRNKRDQHASKASDETNSLEDGFDL